ncbi:MAG: hypothetical protein AB8E82_20055 [Aureispira sp.]
MAEDTKIAVQHLADIIVPALMKRKDERVELDRQTKKYFTALKKRLSEEVIAGLEASPEDEAAQNAFKDALEALMDKSQNVKMNSAIFLAQKGVEL